MDEWGVVGVIIALIGVVGAVVAPMIKLNTAIVKLTITLESVQSEFLKLENSANTAHQRMWNRIDQHSERMENHEHRIKRLEYDNEEDNKK